MAAAQTIMAAYSTVCSLARCNVGAIRASPEALAVLRSCMDETAAVARACGTDIGEEDVQRSYDVRAARAARFPGDGSWFDPGVPAAAAAAARVPRGCRAPRTSHPTCNPQTLLNLPADCTPSMWRDIEAGRPSELEAQAATVVRLGGEKGVATPVLSSLVALLAIQERVNAAAAAAAAAAAHGARRVAEEKMTYDSGLSPEAVVRW